MLKADATNAKKNHAPRAMKPPAYRERVPYGQAIVTLTDSRTKKRRDYWLGTMNSPGSRELYFRVLAAWESNGRCWPEVPGTSGRTAKALVETMNDEPTRLTINELVRDYWAWANGYYSGSELSSLKVALRLLRRMFGSTPAADFGPKRLRLVRDDMVRGDANADPPRIPWSRKHTNGQIHRIGAMFKWASAHEKLPITVYLQLKAMPSLKRGRSDARETESVKPVALGLVEATKPCVNRQVGPIAYTESTTLTKIFDEDANRCLILQTDESDAQTRRIMKARAFRETRDAPDLTPVQAVHHAMQRLLMRVRVQVPFAEILADALPAERPEARRAFNHTLALIKSVTLLHQRQRAPLGLAHGDVIQATVVDYQIAKRLLEGPLSRSLGSSIAVAAANLGRRLSSQYGGEVFTTSQAVKNDPVLKSRGKMSDYLNTLETAGVLTQVEPGKGSKPASWKVVGDVPAPGALWLPDPEVLEHRA